MSESDRRELDYGPIGPGDRVIVHAPNGRAGSNLAKFHGQQGTVTKAGPTNCIVEIDGHGPIRASRTVLLKNNSGLKATPAPVQHGYGDTSDCLCGRNFSKVRGLREHITKARGEGS